MRPERLFALFLLGMGALASLLSWPNLLRSWRCGLTPRQVTVEELERAGPPAPYLRIGGISGPQPAPLAPEAGSEAFCYPLLSPGRRESDPGNPRVFVLRFAAHSAPLAAPVTGLLARYPEAYVEDIRRGRYPGLQAGDAVILIEGQRPPGFLGSLAGVCVGLLLAAAGLATAALSLARGRSAVVGRIIALLCPPLGVFGVALGVNAVFLLGVRESAAAPFLAFFSAGCIASAFLLAVRARRHLALSADEQQALDPRPPVLYLRAFQADESTSRVTESFGGKTEEELTAEVLGAFGPVVAVGRPGERLPEAGAARLYVGDAQWQEVVAAYMDRCALVVLRLGTTMGFWWELERSGKTLDPARLLILSPYARESYDEFRAQARARFSKPLPDMAESGSGGVLRGRLGTLRGAIFFRKDWKAEYVDVAGASWPWSYAFASFGRQRLHKALLWSLRTFFDRRGVAWRPRPRWGRPEALNLAVCACAAGLYARDAAGGFASVKFLIGLSAALFVSAALRLAFSAALGRPCSSRDPGPASGPGGLCAQ